MTTSSRQALHFMARLLNLGLRAIAALIVIEWVIGRAVSDRYWWSQWLLWASFTPAAILAAGFLTVAWRPRMTARRRRVTRMVWIAACAALLVHFLAFEHRFVRLPTAPIENGFTITHWNGTHVNNEDFEDYADALIAAGGDVVMLTDAPFLAAHPRVREWLEEHRFRTGAHPFIVFSRLPILRVQVLAAADEIAIVLLEMQPPPGSDDREPIILYAVDMPSDPKIPRMELARKARRYMDESGAPPPDLVVGDLNITRGAASLRTMFPGMTHAFDQAGRGYSATFPVDWPLYHIDHILVGPKLRASSYELINPGIGRHLIQRATIAPTPLVGDRHGSAINPQSTYAPRGRR